jgi:adenosine kinase
MNGESMATGRPNVVLSGSLAFDYIMTFPGSFKEHILPDKMHVLSVSFLFDTLKRLRGGIAGNIAWNLALLGERPAVVGAGGSDFGEYRAALDDVGVDTSGIVEAPDYLTGSSFMLGDLGGNQIAGFYPGASAVAADHSIADRARSARFGVVSATTLEAMRRHAEEIAAVGCKLVYDPSQQVVALPAADIEAGLALAWAVVGSDYEFAMMERKTGLSVEAIAARVPLTVVTLAAEGSVIHHEGNAVRIPAARPERLADATGGGDAYRAGLIKGLLLDLDLAVCGRMGSAAAVWAIERHGTQEHRYDADEFVARFDAAFPDFAGAVAADALRRPVPAGTRI